MQTWLTGCWGTRRGIEAPHSFSYRRHDDLTVLERRMVAPRQDGKPTQKDDVIVFVKNFMADREVSQQPFVVCADAHSRTAKCTPQPTGLRPMGDWTSKNGLKRVNELRNLATLLESDGFKMFRAAKYLREMPGKLAPVVPTSSFLSGFRKPAATQPIHPVGFDGLFTHLPPWRMVVKMTPI